MFTTTTAQPTRSIPPFVAAGIVTAAAGVGLSAVVIAVRLAPMSFVVVAALLPLTAAAVVDAAERRLPNRLVLLSIAPVAFVCGLDPFVGRLTAVGDVVSGALLLATPLLVLHLIAPIRDGLRRREGGSRARCRARSDPTGARVVDVVRGVGHHRRVGDRPTSSARRVRAGARGGGLHRPSRRRLLRGSR